MKKQCSQCREEKDFTAFHKDKRTKNGLYSACKSCHSIYRRNWQNKNKEKIKIAGRDYQRNYQRERKIKDIKFRLNHNVSTIMYQCLKGKKEWQSWKDLVGYEIEDLIRHIEKQFDENMTWENYGSYWEVDHKIPKSWFKYNVPKDQEFKKCWALENLQPLEKKANRKKYNKFSD